MRVICLDVGEKRIGVAVSDPLDITAQGLETIWCAGRQKDIEKVVKLANYYETDRILCGLPRNMDGSEGFQAEYVRSFAEALIDAGLKVQFQDERMTTKMATSVLLQGNVPRQKRKNVVDKLAATYILQSFLDAGGWKEPKKIFLGGIYKMSEFDESLDMEQENIVELIDEEGNTVTFEHIMTLEHNGKPYICLIPLEGLDDVEEDELIIMRVETDADGNDYYVTIDNEVELNSVFEKYLEIAEADE